MLLLATIADLSNACAVIDMMCCVMISLFGVVPAGVFLVWCVTYARLCCGVAIVVLLCCCCCMLR